MPKKPMTTGTNRMPSSSEVMPKSNRGAPSIGSMPTKEKIRPTTPITRALVSDFPASAITRESPTRINEKYSGGPNLRAKRDRGSAMTTSPSVATVPPMKEPMAAMPSAAPARPCLAIA
jgi:hypothetical protein